MLTSSVESHTASISNLCDTKYYIDNGNMRYELATADSVSDLGVRVDSKLSLWIIEVIKLVKHVVS